MDIQVFARELYEKKILQFGEFTLKDGSQSRFYLDLRVLPSHPALFRRVVEALEGVIVKEWGQVDAVAGIMSAGVPYATGLMMRMGLPLLQIRKEQKSYGGKKQVEGCIPGNGKNVVLIDDVITSGTSKIPAIRAIKNAGWNPVGIVVVIDRSFGKSRLLEEQEGIPVRAVTLVQELFRGLLEGESIAPEEKEIIEQVLKESR